MVAPLYRRTVAAISLPIHPPEGAANRPEIGLLDLVTPLRATSIGSS